VARRPEGFLFDAPHLANPDVSISNVASKSGDAKKSAALVPLKVGAQLVGGVN
jgi:hypothetical protein